MTRLVNEADIVNKTRPLFTLSLEMTKLVKETRLLLVPSINSDIYCSVKPRLSTPIYYRPRLPQLSPLQYTAIYGGCNQISVNYLEDQEDVLSFTEDLLLSPSVSLVKG